jgi:hypothetical protein
VRAPLSFLLCMRLRAAGASGERESFLPEIAGDAALLVDPYDADDIARAITAIRQRRRSARRVLAPRTAASRQIFRRALS